MSLTYLDAAMIDLHTYLLFVATAAVLVLSPGPDTVFVLSRTLASGPAAGLATLLGTQIGNVVHAVLAGVGVTTAILLLPALFEGLKLVGVVYLLYLAVQAWRASAFLDIGALRSGSAGLGRCFAQGLANNLANPKMIVFFVALFPQFVRPEAGGLAVQSLVLGATLGAMAVVWIGAWVLAAGRVRGAVTASPGVLKLANRFAAVTFVGLACRLAVEESR